MSGRADFPSFRWFLQTAASRANAEVGPRSSVSWPHSPQESSLGYPDTASKPSPQGE